MGLMNRVLKALGKNEISAALKRSACPFCGNPLLDEDIAIDPPEDAGGYCTGCDFKRVAGQRWTQAAEQYLATHTKTT